MRTADEVPPTPRPASWSRTIVTWHWISSAVSLVGMLLFAITGITLNHASQIEGNPQVESRTAEMPQGLQDRVRQIQVDGSGTLPVEVASWLTDRFEKPIGSRLADWSDDEIYLSMPGPGTDAWLAIDRETGMVEFERTQRGWISYFNDLHKGRNTGPAWKWVLDLFALATVVFCVTGLMLLIQHARRRRLTWPLVALGFVAPALVAILLIH
ncbi:PepSY-associated TM helix domain-containing protein [Novipirellula aureliae]